MGNPIKLAARHIQGGLIPAFVLGILTALSAPASADIVYDVNITTLGTGFGSVPRMLTVDQSGSSINPQGYESACDGNSGGNLSIGQCLGTDAAIGGNGYTVPNSGDSVSGGKDSLVTLSSVGITDASQIVIIYNPSQEGGATQQWTDIIDITLKFYGSNNQVLTSADGGCGDTCSFSISDSLYFPDACTNLGNGGTGFALVLDATQAAAVNAACGVNLVNCITMALETTIANANDGPESFYLYTTNLVPEPLTLSLMTIGLLGMVSIRRRVKRA